jgi:lysyl-tRNA synthetase class 2
MSEDELYRARLGKAEALRASGIEPWAVRFDRTHLAAALHAEHTGLEPGGSSGITVRIAGRLMTTREQGKLAFGDLVDGSGKIQLFVGGDQVLAFNALDTGDLIGIEGEVVRTRRGELSVRPSELVLLAKALRPLPDKWHGLRDVEVRYRQRHLDLIANPQAREIALMRPRVIRALRAFLDERDFVEVETPILHPIPSGAAARPFSTRYNALDADFYLRVAPELYLKRLVVGGLERVYEIGRTFRNEGVSYKYNPEFTMLEAYQAYADYLDVMELVQGLLQDVATEALGRTAVTFEGEEIELGGDWTRVRMLDLVSETIGREVSFEMPVDDLRAEAAKRDVEVQPWWGHGMLIAELYDKVAEPRIVQPTIVYDYPLDISPLARTHREDPNLTERFEVVVAGRELGNAFSELNDPIEQRRRFELQMQARDHGDVEASPMDEPYVSALEYGLPPTGGFGIGVDRFVMLLAGVHSIREVILFPALRPEV